MSDIETLSSEFTEVRDSLEEANRKIAVLESRETETEVRSELTVSEALVRAFNGEKVETRAIQSTADNAKQNIWANKPLGFVEQRRPLKAVFGSSPIPGDSGTSIEYARVGTRTGSVAKQAAEGDALTYNKVTIVSDSAPIETFGGYAEFSVQALRFGKAPLLETTVRHLEVEYAKAAETKVRNALTGIINANLNVVTRGAVTGAAAGSAWIGAVEDGLAMIEDNSRGLAGNAIVVSRDIHKLLLTTTDTSGRPLFEVNRDGSNTFGSVAVNAGANVAGLPVVSVPQLAANTFYVVSSDALCIWEEGILELTDKNIVNLTELRSLYGYIATGVFDGKGVAKVTWA
ncbi:hypothetical protein GCM10007304_30250 [Rhodococcoides trifolii]|uniref:Phage major capsid protein n=1 Tax=Rhodococcoides trifolii TaxID=908250 RepID=A0A917LD68_9NOCA|nr:phage major capsid protein [Rhodococcus trifolii]GGG14110.1 hypothetical protein GCM10007304_30250 [Rhodococcus trifolii]